MYRFEVGFVHWSAGLRRRRHFALVGSYEGIFSRYLEDFGSPDVGNDDFVLKPAAACNDEVT